MAAAMLHLHRLLRVRPQLPLLGLELRHPLPRRLHQNPFSRRRQRQRL
jgi:hypothetical protein